MYEITTFYNSLNNIEKQIFRERMLKAFNIKYMSFYNWINRNNVPKRKREKYMEMLKNGIKEYKKDLEV